MPLRHSLLSQEFKEQAEQTASDMRDALNLPKYAPLCAFKLAKYLGIPVKSVYELGIADDGEMYDDWSAILIYNKFGKPIIIHNTKHSRSRQQSNIMHEIGHYHCKHPLTQQPLEYLLPTLMVTTNSLHEEEALYLGATLQLPKVALSWAIYSKKMTIQEIAKMFLASQQMVQFRINATGLSKEMKHLQMARQ